jgi:hypothetical protein
MWILQISHGSIIRLWKNKEETGGTDAEIRIIIELRERFHHLDSYRPVPVDLGTSKVTVPQLGDKSKF